MARTLTVDYTLYSPEYVPGEGVCSDFRNLQSAKRYACRLGTGSTIIKNFNQTTRKGHIDWWQARFFWLLKDGTFLKRLADPQNKRWSASRELYSTRPRRR